MRWTASASTACYDAHGSELTNADLDACHGRTSPVTWNGRRVSIYHYVLTREYPYTVGCFKGTPAIDRQRRGPRGGRGRPMRGAFGPEGPPPGRRSDAAFPPCEWQALTSEPAAVHDAATARARCVATPPCWRWVPACVGTSGRFNLRDKGLR